MATTFAATSSPCSRWRLRLPAAAGALLGIFQSYMPPDAFALETSGQLVIQTVMGGAGTLIGPTVGAAIWLSLRDLLQLVPGVGDLWKFILGFVFVVLVTFMPNGVVGTIMRLTSRFWQRRPGPAARAAPHEDEATREALLAPLPSSAQRRESPPTFALEAQNISKSYGGIHAVEGVSLALPEGTLHAIIGPNGAGKSTFLRLLAREEALDSGRILLRGIDITAADVTAAYQYGLAKSYQINQLFPQLTVRENLRLGALARERGKLRLDVFRSADSFSKVEAAGCRAAARTWPRQFRRPRCQHPPLWREAPARTRPRAGVAALGAAAR